MGMFFRIVRSRRGTILVQVLVISAVFPLLMYPLLRLSLDLGAQTQETSKSRQEQIVLDSTIDYLSVAVKQRWCLTPELMRDDPCALEHSRNTERLLLNDDALEVIAESDNSMLDVRLGEISGEVPLSGFALLGAHPLKQIISSLPPKKFKHLTYKIRRLDSEEFPVRGDEVHISITVGLTAEELFSSSFKREARVIVFPRELGSFGLVVAGDLMLDGGKGRAKIPTIGEGHQGIRFESPVFVQGDIHVPSKGLSHSVNFLKKVVLGFGALKLGGEVVSPANAGGPDERLFSSSKGIGGFLAGIDQDGIRDKGLDYFSGRSKTVIPDTDLMTQCIERSQSLSVLSATSQSALVGKISSERSNQYSFLLGLTEGNELRPQEIEEGKQLISVSGGSFYNNPMNDFEPGDEGGSSLRVKVDFNGSGHVVVAEMSMNGELKIKPNFLGTPAEAAAAAKALEKKCKDAEKSWAALSTAVALALTPETKALALAAASAAKVKKDKVCGDWEEAKSNVAESENAERRPPEIVVKLKPAIINGVKGKSEQPNQAVLEVEIENEKYMNKAPRIELTLYGVGYQGGEDIRVYIDDEETEEDERTGNVNYSRKGSISFQVKDDRVSLDKRTIHSSWKVLDSGKVGEIASPLNENTDYGYYSTLCNNSDVGGNAFGTADWSNDDFSKSTNHSWNFADPLSFGTWNITGRWRIKWVIKWIVIIPVLVPVREFVPLDESIFHVRSIVDRCVIKDDIKFFAGFVACRKLTIEKRSKPLRLVGTFIVDELVIDKSAVESGIVWSSIYSPNAELELREKGVLQAFGGESCENSSDAPIWHPFPDIKSLSNRYSCHSLSLRDQADPFKWTTVDPDCGLRNGDNNVVCKRRPKRFIMREYSRKDTI